MPRLSFLQWFAVVVFLFFYGFSVFAFTRDYYQRNPPQTAASAAAAVSQVANPHTGSGSGTPAATLTPTPETVAALLADTADPARLVQLGDELFVQRRYGEAIPVYRRILELDPGNAEVHNDLGLALHYSGDIQAALTLLRAGSQLAPEHQRLWLTLGFVSMHAELMDESRAALERARDLDSETSVGKEAVRLLELLSRS